jgi:hypothetical protein
MASINLITGTAKGRIGQLQYQTRGLQCVVRSRQPGGLTNDQAEYVNKPVLIALSSAYHNWARYLLMNYGSDRDPIQALWNYYTRCNRAWFTSTPSWPVGYQLSLHTALEVYEGSYQADLNTEDGAFYFNTYPGIFSINTKVIIVVGLSTKPIADCTFYVADLSDEIHDLPFWDSLPGSADIGFFFYDTVEKKLKAGLVIATIQDPVPLPFWTISQDFIDNHISLTVVVSKNAYFQTAIYIDMEDVPEPFNEYDVLLTWKKAFEGHNINEEDERSIGEEIILGEEDAMPSVSSPLVVFESYDWPRSRVASTPISLTPILVPFAWSAGEQTSLLKIRYEIYEGDTRFYLNSSAMESDYDQDLWYFKFTPSGTLASLIGTDPVIIDFSNDQYLDAVVGEYPLSGVQGTLLAYSTDKDYVISDALNGLAVPY